MWIMASAGRVSLSQYVEFFLFLIKSYVNTSEHFHARASEERDPAVRSSRCCVLSKADRDDMSRSICERLYLITAVIYAENRRQYLCVCGQTETH